MNVDILVTARKSRHTHKTMWKNTHNNNQGKQGKK